MPLAGIWDAELHIALEVVSTTHVKFHLTVVQQILEQARSRPGIRGALLTDQENLVMRLQTCLRGVRVEYDLANHGMCLRHTPHE